MKIPIDCETSYSDLAPSLQAVKKAVSQNVHVYPVSRVNRTIVSQSSKVITFDTKKHSQYFKDKT